MLCACGCGGLTPVIRKNHTARGYVKGQHHRFIRGHVGRVSLAPFRVAGAGNGNWRGDDAGYNAVHLRLREVNGPASDYPCIDECGRMADDWSYKERAGYSTNLDDYTPRCRSCHKERDCAPEESVATTAGP